MWKKNKHPAKVTVKYDVGFKNTLYIRGNGAGLSWEKGRVMRNTGTDTWVWESEAPVRECEFKVLINDQIYEEGANRRLMQVKVVQYSPTFKK